MSQTNTHINNGQYRYQNSRRGGRGQGPNFGSGRGDPRNDRGDKSITKYSFKGKMKDSPISELTITETGHRPSQFKKLYDALPVFCLDKNDGGLDEVLSTGHDQVEGDFMLPYPNATIWPHTHQIQVATVTERAILIKGSLSSKRVATYDFVNKTIVTDVNLQKELLSEYKRNSKLKFQEYSKFLQDKKSLITILYGQYDEETQNEISLGEITQITAMKEGFWFLLINYAPYTSAATTVAYHIRHTNKL